jgi:hypothetical protein
MPCIQMKELQVSYVKYDERRLKSIPASSERRKGVSGKRLVGQAELAYIMRVHKQTCAECRRKG